MTVDFSLKKNIKVRLGGVSALLDKRVYEEMLNLPALSEPDETIAIPIWLKEIDAGNEKYGNEIKITMGAKYHDKDHLQVGLVVKAEGREITAILNMHRDIDKQERLYNAMGLVRMVLNFTHDRGQ